MQNSFQVQRDLSYLLSPESPMGFDIPGAQKALERRAAEARELEAQQAKESQQAELADRSIKADEGIMNAPSNSGKFEVISQAEKGQADAIAANPPQEPAPVNPQKSTDAEFSEAVQGENSERELRKAAGEDAVSPDVTSPPQLGQDQAVRGQGHWKDSGQPGSQIFETAADAYEYFKSIGNDVSAASVLEFQTGRRQKAETGLIETTSPVEFAITSAGSLGAMAVNQARKATGKYLGGVAVKAYSRYMKSFALGSPFEFAATIGAEELAEDHPFAGIAAEVAFGVGTGAVTDALVGGFTKTAKAATKVPSIVDSPSISKAVETLAAERTGASRWTTEEAQRYYSSYGHATMRKAHRPTNLGNRLTQAEAERIFRKLAKGDLRDPDTREVYKRALSDAEKDIAQETEFQANRAVENKKEASANLEESALVSTAGGEYGADERKVAVQSLKKKIEKIETGESVNPASEKAQAASEAVSEVKTIPSSPSDETLKSDVYSSKAQSGQKVLSTKYSSLKHKIKEEWYGPDGSDFEEDVTASFNAKLKAARDAGEPIQGKQAKELYRKVLVETRREYDEAIDSEVWARVREIENSPAVALRSEYVRGLSGAEDRYEVAPGTIVKREQVEGDTTSRYQYKDWDITDHLVFTNDKTGLVLKSDLPNNPPIAQTDFKLPDNYRPAVDYSAISSRSDVMNRLAAKFKYWGSPKRKVFHGEDKRPDFPAVDRLKVPTEIWDKELEAYKTVPMLPDSEVEAVAKLYGWNDSMVEGYTYKRDPKANAPSRIDSDSGRESYLVNLLPEDVIKGRDDLAAMEITNPGWFDSQKKLVEEPGVTKDPKFYEMSGAIQAYRKQRKAYLEQMFNLTVSRLGEGEKNEYFNSMLERIVAMRNDILKDIKLLEGTNYGPYAKRAYIAFGDLLAGTNRLDDLHKYSEKQIRQKAFWEYEAFKSGGMSDADIFDASVASRMDETGESYEEAAEYVSRSSKEAKARYYEETARGDFEAEGLSSDTLDAEELGKVSDADIFDASVASRMDETGESYEEATEYVSRSSKEAKARYYEETARGDFEAEGLSSDTLDAEELGKASDAAGTSMGGRIIQGAASPEAQSATGPATAKGIKRLVMDMDEDVLNAQVIQMEDKFGVRFADDLWSPTAANGSGRINIWRVNTLEDLNSVFTKLDKPVTLDTGTTTTALKSSPIDVEASLGLKPHGSHSADMSQRMAHVIQDSSRQLDELAEQLLVSPDDTVTALAWSKLQHMTNVMTSTLESGKPSDSAMKAWKQLDLTAGNDRELLEKAINAVNKAMPLDQAGKPSTKHIAMQADMYADIETRAGKIGLLKRASRAGVDDLTDAYAGQQKLYKILTDACK